MPPILYLVELMLAHEFVQVAKDLSLWIFEGDFS